ncbi:hypothetical protein BJG92_00867 [Arthrobacter sp. SO5]|uniref:hypothetical protein n=1 Tax=Arthrobacter sp. SO5 TaxID=1897055 RepID=UPI001E3685D1|nr:hypothetical protein [Arthrobacter sp. SO5]MCB5273347.1 hypothetical protein [Arthrobacter sp. SO5]
MAHTTPGGAFGLTSVQVPRPRGRHLRECRARLGGMIRRLPIGLGPVNRGLRGTPPEDLLMAGAWRNPFLDEPSPDPPKSPRATVYNG